MSRPRAERDAILQQEEIFGFFEQSNISAKNIARLKELSTSPNAETASLAAVVLEVALVKPQKRKRFAFLARTNLPLLKRLEAVGLVDCVDSYFDSLWEDDRPYEEASFHLAEYDPSGECDEFHDWCRMMPMEEHSRFDAFAPDLATALRAASESTQQRIAGFAADWAIARAGLAHPALASADPGAVAALATELDEQYLTLLDKHEEGQASLQELTTAFAWARAASAADFARRGKPAEALYEAACSVEDWSELRLAIFAQFRRTFE